jgi:ParB family chromosome partitioning protein
MISTRVLIVEPDHPFGLSLASLFQDDGCATRVAGSAAEAEMEIATRRPDLVVVRAELPDLSGFSLCARLRHHPATERLPIILYSSETAPASLAEHARTRWAADGYLAMPLDASALRALARRILVTASVVESADDAVIEEAEPLPEPPAAGPPPRSAPRLEQAAGTPPPVPRRQVRSNLNDEDRHFVDRTFQSIAERRDALLAEAQRNRPPPRRDLLQTADGRLQLLRDDLKAREAQIARLAEIWEIREREVAYAGEWLHEKDVELQGLKGQVEELRGRLAEARELVATKERQHGASIEAMLLEKVTQEKELIELVAGSERKLHEAERRHETAWRALEERLGAVDAERSALAERVAALVAELASERERGASVDAELAAARARGAAIEAELGEVRSAAAAAAGAGAERRAEELQADLDERDRLLAVARRENERLQGELTAARHDYMVSESEAQVARERATRADELAGHLELALRERDEARAAVASPAGDGDRAKEGDPGEPGARGGDEPSAEPAAPGAGQGA